MFNKTSPLSLTRMERRNINLTLSNIHCKVILLRTTCTVPYGNCWLTATDVTSSKVCTKAD